MAFFFTVIPLVSWEARSFAAARVKHGQPRVKLGKKKKAKKSAPLKGRRARRKVRQGGGPAE
jgi:hypothetical protein